MARNKYFIIFFGILLLLFGQAVQAQPPAVQAQPPEKQVVITGSVVNVRSGPGLNHSLVTRVAAGDKLALVTTEHDWYKVRLADNRMGWVANWLGQIVEPQSTAMDKPPSLLGKGRVTGTYVNVRSGPGLNFEQVHRVHQGQEIVLLSKDGDWFQIQLAGQRTGWIAGWLVELESSEQKATQEQVGQSFQESNQSSSANKMAVTLVDNINARGGAGTTHPVLQTLAMGESYRVIQQEQDWLQIQLSNDRAGWVASWLVELVEAEGTDSEILDSPRLLGVGIVSGDVVNVRQGAGTQFPRVAQARSGDEFAVLAEQNSWYKVQLQSNQQGWIAGQFLTVREGQTTLVSRGDQPHSLQGKLIVLDPGHGRVHPTGGWNDPGAIGPTGVKERDVVLDISRRLKALLEEQGAQVALTRSGDTTTLSLHERAELANNLKADIFISVHANASLSANQNGTMVFFFANDPRIHTQRVVRNNLAQEIQRELVQELKLADLGVRQSNFVVLRETTMPSVLVEVAFLSNPAEEKLLADQAFRQRSAEAMARGVVNFFQKSGNQ